MLRADARFLPSLERLDHRDGIRGGQVLVVVVRVPRDAVRVVRHRDHRRVHAAPHALHLAQREHPVGGVFKLFDPEMIAQRLLDVARAAQHAGRRAAHHDVVLPHRHAVEHGVERGHLVDADRRHLQKLGDAVHHLHGEEAVVLLLRDVEERDHRAALVVGGYRCRISLTVGMFSSEKDHVSRSLLSGVSRCCVYEEKKRDFT